MLISISRYQHAYLVLVSWGLLKLSCAEVCLLVLLLLLLLLLLLMLLLIEQGYTIEDTGRYTMCVGGCVLCIYAWMCDVCGNTTIQRNVLLFSLAGYYFLPLNVAQLTHVRLHQHSPTTMRGYAAIILNF